MQYIKPTSSNAIINKAPFISYLYSSLSSGAQYGMYTLHAFCISFSCKNRMGQALGQESLAPTHLGNFHFWKTWSQSNIWNFMSHRMDRLEVRTYFRTGGPQPVSRSPLLGHALLAVEQAGQCVHVSTCAHIPTRTSTDVATKTGHHTAKTGQCYQVSCGC